MDRDTTRPAGIYAALLERALEAESRQARRASHANQDGAAPPQQPPNRSAPVAHDSSRLPPLYTRSSNGKSASVIDQKRPKRPLDEEGNEPEGDGWPNARSATESESVDANTEETDQLRPKQRVKFSDSREEASIAAPTVDASDNTKKRDGRSPFQGEIFKALGHTGEHALVSLIPDERRPKHHLSKLKPWFHTKETEGDQIFIPFDEASIAERWVEINAKDVSYMYYHWQRWGTALHYDEIAKIVKRAIANAIESSREHALVSDVMKLYGYHYSIEPRGATAAQLSDHTLLRGIPQLVYQHLVNRGFKVSIISRFSESSLMERDKHSSLSRSAYINDDTFCANMILRIEPRINLVASSPSSNGEM